MSVAGHLESCNIVSMSDTYLKSVMDDFDDVLPKASKCDLGFGTGMSLKSHVVIKNEGLVLGE